MKNIKEWDICILDESKEYLCTSKAPYKVIVLWCDYSQPLVTKVGEYHPFWTTYNELCEVIGHIDIFEQPQDGDKCTRCKYREIEGKPHAMCRCCLNGNRFEEDMEQPQNGDRAVSLNAVIKAVDAHTNDDDTLDDDISCILDDLPSVEPQEGEWIKHNGLGIDINYEPTYHCSKCDFSNKKETNFCPNCGARMVGDGGAR